ncbi:hemolysin family protein [Mycoplasma iguanae]|uniref:Hemolysin family protein n=1 Tax=Mycoplasma iguanae TaxID=292461 RepID=A0ABY5R8C5_9MOLU|nr:hemolysin family protein [Mycoplasma iguanae]UVD81756.1 hemolysin family protein [Mycoplasma iguanae]
MEPWLVSLIIIILIILIICSALFSALETAYGSISLAKLEQELHKKSLTKKIIEKHYKHFGRTLSTILIGNNLINISASSILSAFLGVLISNETVVVLITMLVMTPIIVIFGEIIPKIFARKYPLKYVKRVFLIMEFFYIIFFPLTYPISKFVKSEEVTNTEKDLKTFLAIGHKEGILEKKEALLAINALDLDSVRVSKSYKKIKDVYFVEASWTLKEAKKVFLDTNYSRLPVKKNNRFIGIILLKNIWNHKKGLVEDFVTDVPSISYNTLLTKAMEKMRLEKAQFAFVTQTNNSKKVIGILSFEDIIEELVGEVYDESDEEIDIYEINLQHAIVKGDNKISKINNKLNFSLPNEDLTLLQWLEKISQKDVNMKFKFKYKKYEFKVVENKRKSVPKIEINQK